VARAAPLLGERGVPLDADHVALELRLVPLLASLEFEVHRLVARAPRTEELPDEVHPALAERHDPREPLRPEHLRQLPLVSFLVELARLRVVIADLARPQRAILHALRHPGLRHHRAPRTLHRVVPDWLLRRRLRPTAR